ncbi:hypothetical protein [Moorena producens]|uniref:hypothetical protein n=1 Tax=Moorena producens TaxID=1155739 RepID=UPI003C78A019
MYSSRMYSCAFRDTFIDILPNSCVKKMGEDRVLIFVNKNESVGRVGRVGGVGRWGDGEMGRFLLRLISL